MFTVTCCKVPMCNWNLKDVRTFLQSFRIDISRIKYALRLNFLNFTDVDMVQKFICYPYS